MENDMEIIDITLMITKYNDSDRIARLFEQYESYFGNPLAECLYEYFKRGLN